MFEERLLYLFFTDSEAGPAAGRRRLKNILGQPDRGLVGVGGLIQRCRRS
jgi:hypothetical protein